jgi:hypothetical protein
MVVREKERGRLRIGSVAAENKAFFFNTDHIIFHCPVS